MYIYIEREGGREGERQRERERERAVKISSMLDAPTYVSEISGRV
jgi:hypothetical protein